MATCQQNIFVEEFFHVWNELDPQLGRQDVSGSDEELFPQMGNLVRTDRQQREHPLHHQAGVVAHLLLVDPAKRINNNGGHG